MSDTSSIFKRGRFMSASALATAASLALCAFFTAPGVGASASDAELGGKVLVSGTVTIAAPDDSQTPSVGAEVRVWWIPGMAHARPGDELDVEAVGTATTAADGTYAVSVTPSQAMAAAAASNGGWLNFDVGVIDPAGRSTTTGVSRRLDGAVWSTPPSTSALLQDEGTAAALSLRPELDLRLAEGASARRPAATPTDVPCSFITTATPQRRVSIVEFHNAGNADGTWSYGRAADTDIESGIDLGGRGDWSIGATRHIANTSGTEISRSYVGGDRVNNYGRTDFAFVDGYYKPYGIGTECAGTSVPVRTEVKNPVSWAGGIGANDGAGSEYLGCSHAPQQAHRTAYPVNSRIVRNYNRAAEIGLAVDLGPISVAATSGYSESVALEWRVKRGHGIWLCGTNYDVTHAGVIHAQNRP